MAAKLRELESVPLGGAGSACPVATKEIPAAGETVSYDRLRKLVEKAIWDGWEVQIDGTAISSIEVLDDLVHHAGVEAICVNVSHVFVQGRPYYQMKIDCSW